MTNHAIARSFTLLADLLELEGENLFKVRAYRKAAEEIEGLTENLESIAARGELEAIPNIGKAIAEKIADICRTGTTKLYEELKAEVPAGLVEVMAVPGIGPSKVRALHEAGAVSADDLPSEEDFQIGVSEERITTTVDIRPWLARKRAAERQSLTLDPGAINNPVQGPIAFGARGDAVVRAQILLARAHFSCGAIDGNFGGNLQKTVAAYQNDRKLPVTGTLDIATWGELNTDTAPALMSLISDSSTVSSVSFVTTSYL